MQSKENMTRLEHPLSFNFSSSGHNVQTYYLKVYSGSEQYGNMRNHELKIFLMVPYCSVDVGYGLGRSLGDCRPALLKG